MRAAFLIALIAVLIFQTGMAIVSCLNAEWGNVIISLLGILCNMLNIYVVLD